jgi:hypothetical protein
MTPTTRQVVLMKRTAVSAFPGPELVTGGDFSSSSGWTLNGAASFATISGGTLNGSGTGGDVATGARLAAGTLVPGTYRVTFDIVAGSTIHVWAFVGGSSASIVSNPYTDGTIGTHRTALGSYSQDIVVASVAGQYLGIILDTTNAKVDNFSVKQVA